MSHLENFRDPHQINVFARPAIAGNRRAGQRPRSGPRTGTTKSVYAYSLKGEARAGGMGKDTGKIYRWVMKQDTGDLGYCRLLSVIK